LAVAAVAGLKNLPQMRFVTVVDKLVAAGVTDPTAMPPGI
jgi:hypothetical protein